VCDWRVYTRKIKRIIFESVRKWDGRCRSVLSTSQIKQIAGRAGRYYADGEDSPGGLATTLYPNDLPILHDALATPLPPIQTAYVSAPMHALVNVLQALPPRPTTATIHEVHLYIAKMRPIYRFEDLNKLYDICQFIDTYAGELTLDDRNRFIKSPIAWWDPLCVKVASRFMQMYRDSMRVVLVQSLKNSNLLETLRRTEIWMTANRPPPPLLGALSLLETFHKVLVLYLWLSLRNPVVFCDQEVAMELKARVERALQWSLQNMSQKELQRDDANTGEVGEGDESFCHLKTTRLHSSRMRMVK
jgi:ATP-dependent RNA helicase SUPV3L1/SUV3